MRLQDDKEKRATQVFDNLWALTRYQRQPEGKVSIQSGYTHNWLIPAMVHCPCTCISKDWNLHENDLWARIHSYFFLARPIQMDRPLLQWKVWHWNHNNCIVKKGTPCEKEQVEVGVELNVNWSEFGHFWITQWQGKERSKSSSANRKY